MMNKFGVHPTVSTGFSQTNTKKMNDQYSGCTGWVRTGSLLSRNKNHYRLSQSVRPDIQEHTKSHMNKRHTNLTFIGPCIVIYRLFEMFVGVLRISFSRWNPM